MVIKSEKGYYVHIIMSILLPIGSIELICDVGDNLELKMIKYSFYAFCILLVMDYWIVVGRTLIMNEKGCTVCFLWFRKEYLWEELAIKRIEDYHNCNWGRGVPAYEGGAVFSLRDNVHRSERKNLVDYLMYHPIISLNTFFVYFQVEPEEKKKRGFTSGSGLYEIDEKIFRENMKKWGVELEEPKKRYRR